jgi:hypothetical protein
MMVMQILLLLLILVGVSTEKDSNYYPWGTNPNVNYEMYWHDAANVLQDIDQFDSLYIKYHGCV